MKKADLIAYAEAFASFLINKIKHPIKEIILFGSAARGEATEESDVDIFINVQNVQDIEKITNTIKKIEHKFYRSKQFELWKLKDIDNEIKIKVGVLEKWKLKRSIISDGIVLYGKYKEAPQGQSFALISFEPIKNIAKRNKVVRSLFGRKEEGFYKEGLIKKFKGKRLAPTVAIIPLQFVDEILEILRKEKISFKIFEMWTDQV